MRGEFYVYNFSLFETRSKFIIRPLCGGFVLSLKALTQCKHGVLKERSLFFFFSSSGLLKQREHRKWTSSRKGKQTDGPVSQAHVAVWRRGRMGCGEPAEGGLRGARWRGHLLGYRRCRTHGGCTCGRDVATSVCDTADFPRSRPAPPRPPSGADGGGD